CDLIFQVILEVSTTMLLLGVIPAAVLALGAEFLLGRVEWWITPRGLREASSISLKEAIPGFARARRWEVTLRLILLTAVLGLVLAVPFQASAQERTLVVGGKNFTEQYILAHMIAELLKAHGYPAEAKPGLASGDVILSALRRGDIDMYVEYSGTAWTGFLKQPTEVGIDADWVYEQTAKGMKEQFGLDYLPTLGFSNAYVFAVPRAFAEEHGLEKISDLIPLAGRLTLGGTLAFMGDRPDGIRGAEAVYGFKFRRNRAMD